jgi:hypothetical protein
LEAAQLAFADLNFKVTTGSQYLGSFIGEDDALRSWLAEKTKSWEEAVADIAKVAPNFPQTAYSGLQKSFQQEWQFVQRVTKGIGPTVKGLDLHFETSNLLCPRSFCQPSLEMISTSWTLVKNSPVSW